MAEIKGRIASILKSGNNGFKYGIFKVKEADLELEDIVNKTIFFSGYFADLNKDLFYSLNGEYTNHPEIGNVFLVSSYKVIIPTSKDDLICFLSSSFFPACGYRTSVRIVEKFGEDSIKKIIEDKNNLLLIPGMSEKQAQRIYNSIIEYRASPPKLIESQNKNLGVNIFIEEHNNRKLNRNYDFSNEITLAQIDLINILLQKPWCMESRARIYAEFDVDSLTKLTKEQASTIIKRMKEL